MDDCVRLLREWSSEATNGPVNQFLEDVESPIILTYLDHVPSRWMLGRSAAKFGNLLAITGIGRRFSFADKLASSRRAIQIIRRLRPHSPVIFADALDTMVVNQLSALQKHLLWNLARTDRIILGAECFSYPMCYQKFYSNHTAHQRCRAGGSPTCFVNSGLYTGSSQALLRLLEMAYKVAKSAKEIERDDDQAAMHRLILQGAMKMEVGSA